MGIGRSNNYLENFNVAYSMNNRFDQTKTFTPIIPNSFMEISANTRGADYWELDLKINPSKMLQLSLISFGILLIIIAIVIIIMHIKEKKEDSKNRPLIDF